MRAAISQHSQWSCWETVGSRHPILYSPAVAATAEGASVQPDISPITAAASVSALPTLNILGEVPAFQYQVFRSTSGKEIRIPELDRQHPDIILDALIGYGLRSAPVGTAVRLIEWANASGAPILALDNPSGRNATTGEAPGACMSPRWTMTLALPKTGLLPDTTGDLFLADIGIPQETYQRMQTKYVSPFGKGYWMRLVALRHNETARVTSPS